MPSCLFYPDIWISPLVIGGVSGSFSHFYYYLFYYYYFYFLLRKRIVHFSFTNSVVSDQTPLTAASDQGLHCLYMSFLRGAKTMFWKLSRK